MQQEIKTPGGTFQINVSDQAGKAEFGTDDMAGQVFKPFPEQLHVLESFDQLTYDQVWEHLFTDKFFDLTSAQPVNTVLQSANQRHIWITGEGDAVVQITLTGRLAPNEKLHLYQNCTAAGLTMLPIRVHGLGACLYTEIRIFKELAREA